MNILYAMLGGFALDWIFGDPAWLTHPVVIMGKAIAALESGLRKRLPKTPRGERLAGLTMAIVLPVGTLLLTGGVCRALAAVHPALGFAAELLWCAQALAATGLAQESTNVYRQLQKDDLPAARQAVGRIVGRDTEALTREGVIRAAVETVAENASDGVIAPLFYMVLGGAPLALTYKAVNTMDSMVGYKNERYLHFGRAAAKLDDAANYLPSRIAALLWVAAAALTGNDAKGAWRIWRRDRRNHTSPNSAQTESACAGALGVQLAGPATYFGQYYDKPTIGDATRPIEPEDILRANRMMRAAGVLGLMAAAGIRWVLGWRRYRRLSGEIRAGRAGFFGQRQPAGDAGGGGAGHRRGGISGGSLSRPALPRALRGARRGGRRSEGLDSLRKRRGGFDFPARAGQTAEASAGSRADVRGI